MLASDHRNCNLGFSNSFALKWTKKNIAGEGLASSPRTLSLISDLVKGRMHWVCFRMLAFAALCVQ